MGEPKVAARAGHSIAVLYRFYAKILKGGQQQSNSLIARALDEGNGPDPGPQMAHTHWSNLGYGRVGVRQGERRRGAPPESGTPSDLQHL
uniref:Integrase n=1 Tax=Streptomyces avermitilis TaxID=33903 RepID=A0A499VD26_STRAX|nr:hypothetical protein SAVMC3_48430 [Streptomyces avermitilis]